MEQSFIRATQLFSADSARLGALSAL